MEAYYEFQISCPPSVREQLVAELADEGFEGFEENEKGFSAFIPQSLFNRGLFETILTHYQINPTVVPQNTIEPQNWNAQWEASFEPITIGKDIIVKAPFHLTDTHYRYEIIIQPKNTFGTGHHETTQLVLSLMMQANMQDKRVFDYGCGTGVLSIMAAKLGAAHVYAIDIDAWSAENVHENLALNGIGNVEFSRGDLSIVGDQKFDVVLANINKNILLGSFARLAELINDKGLLIMSGFYESDLQDLQKAGLGYGFNLQQQAYQNNWCAAVFTFNIVV